MSDLVIDRGSFIKTSNVNTLTNELTPLFQEKDVLIRAIFEKCIIDESSIDQHPWIRKIVLVLSTVTSMSAGAFFVPISLQLPVGPLFSTCNYIGYFKLDIWAIRGAISDLLGPKSGYEIILMNRASKGKLHSAVVLISSVTIAILFQIPPSLPAFDYDGFLGLPAFVVLVGGGIFIPTRSIQLSINKIIQTRNCCLDEISKKMEQLRQETLSLIDQHQEMFRKMGYEQQLEHVKKMNQIKDNNLQSAIAFVTNVLTPAIENEKPSRNCLQRNVTKIPGTWIAASLWTGVAYYTFEKTKQDFVDNDYVALALAGTTVLLGVYFSSTSIINTAEKMIAYVYKSLTCQKEKSISEQLRPKLFLSLHLLGLIIDIGALGSTFVIWGNFFKDQEEARIYFVTTVGLANFLFLTSATIDMVDEVVEEIIQKWGDNEEKQIVNLKNRLSMLQKLIKNTSLIDFSFFISKIPIKTKTILLKKLDLTVEKLEDWLDR